MAEFLELTEQDGDKVLVNIEHIVKVRPCDEGSYVYFIVSTGSDSSRYLSSIHVREDYSDVKRKLQI